MHNSGIGINDLGTNNGTLMIGESIMPTNIISVSVLVMILVIGASLSEPHTGSSLSLFRTLHIGTVRMIKCD